MMWNLQDSFFFLFRLHYVHPLIYLYTNRIINFLIYIDCIFYSTLVFIFNFQLSLWLKICICSMKINITVTHFILFKIRDVCYIFVVILLITEEKKSVEIKKDVLFLSSFYSIRMYYVIIHTMSFNGYGNVLTRIYLNEFTVKFHRSIC